MALNGVQSNLMIVEKNNPVIANYSFEWTIDEFTSKPTSEKLISSSFYVGANDLAKWNLQAYPNGQNKESEGYLSLYLTLASSYEYEVSTNVKFSILANVNAKKSKVNVVEIKMYKFIRGDSYGSSKFVKRDFIFNKANGALTNDDKLTLFSEIDVFGRKEDKLVKIRLPEHLQQILVSKQFSDVTLVVDDKEFPAHKAILAARSSVFFAMFNNDMVESKRNRIDIIDIEPKVLQEMLHFIYTDQVPNINEVAEGLLAAADKYQLERLKLMSEEALCRKLNVENAADYFVIADLHNMANLKMQVTDFTCKQAKDVAKTDGFKSMAKDYPNLLVEIFEALAINKLPSPTQQQP